MRIPLFAVVLLLFLGASPSVGQSLPFPKNDTNADLRRFRAESIRGAQEALTQWSAAWARDDAQAAAALHTEGGRLLLPGQPSPAEGSRAIQQALAGQLPQVGPLSLSLTEAEVGGGLVYMYGRYYYESGPGASEAASAAASGNYAAVLQQRGRSWRIRAFFLLPEPLPAGAEEKGGGRER